MNTDTRDELDAVQAEAALDEVELLEEDGTPTSEVWRIYDEVKALEADSPENGWDALPDEVYATEPCPTYSEARRLIGHAVKQLIAEATDHGAPFMGVRIQVEADGSFELLYVD